MALAGPVDDDRVGDRVLVPGLAGRDVGPLGPADPAVLDRLVEDFELKVDGEVKPIGELTRSETPVNVALLFDNSYSLSAAREFEKQAAVRFFKSVVRPIDRAAVYSISNTPTLSQGLTNDVARLVRQARPRAIAATASSRRGSVPPAPGNPAARRPRPNHFDSMPHASVVGRRPCSPSAAAPDRSARPDQTAWG